MKQNTHSSPREHPTRPGRSFTTLQDNTTLEVSNIHIKIIDFWTVTDSSLKTKRLKILRQSLAGSNDMKAAAVPYRPGRTTKASFLSAVTRKGHNPETT